MKKEGFQSLKILSLAALLVIILCIIGQIQEEYWRNAYSLYYLLFVIKNLVQEFNLCRLITGIWVFLVRERKHR